MRKRYLLIWDLWQNSKSKLCTILCKILLSCWWKIFILSNLLKLQFFRILEHVKRSITHRRTLIKVPTILLCCCPESPTSWAGEVCILRRTISKGYDAPCPRRPAKNPENIPCGKEVVVGLLLLLLFGAGSCASVLEA